MLSSLLFGRYKAEGVINADPEKVFSFAYPGVEKPRRMEWDNSLADSGVVAKLSPVCLEKAVHCRLKWSKTFARSDWKPSIFYIGH